MIHSILKPKKLVPFFSMGLCSLLVLVFLLFSKIVLANYTYEGSADSDPVMRLDFPDDMSLMSIPDMEYSMEEFENIEDIELKTLFLGKQMMKLSNMLNSPQATTPEYDFETSELLKQDLEAILLKEAKKPTRADSNLSISRADEITLQQKLAEFTEDVEKRWIYLNQRLVLDKALEHLLTYHTLSYSPEEEFLPQEILTKIEQRFEGLGTLARGMAEIIREELALEKSNELLDSAVNSMFWTGIEIGEITGERNNRSYNLAEITEELIDSEDYRRQELEKQRGELEKEIAVITMQIDQMLASTPWMMFLAEKGNFGDQGLLELIYAYAHRQREQGTNFNPQDLTLGIIKSSIKATVKAKLPEIKNRINAFIEAILTDDGKYIAPLMSLRAETLEEIDQVLLEHENKDNIPNLEDYRKADHEIAQPLGFAANKFNSITWQEIATNVGIAFGSGLILKLIDGNPDAVQANEQKGGNKNRQRRLPLFKTQFDYSRFFPESEGGMKKLNRGFANSWSGRHSPGQFGQIGKGTVLVLSGQTVWVGFNTYRKRKYRSELTEFVPNAMWAGAVSRSYAQMAQEIEYSDLYSNAAFDLIGTFTMTRWFRFLHPGKAQPIKKFFGGVRGGWRLVHNGFKASFNKYTRKRAAGRSWNIIKTLRNKINASTATSVATATKVGVTNTWRFGTSYLKELLFSLGSISVVIHSELNRLERPNLYDSVKKALEPNQGFVPFNVLKSLYDSAMVVLLDGDRRSTLNIITIGAVDFTFILFKNRLKLRTHDMAALYAGSTTLSELVGQGLVINKENSNDPYFSNQTEAHLQAGYLDRLDWERIWTHLGFVSGFSIVKFFGVYAPLRKLVLHAFTRYPQGFRDHSISRFRKYIYDKRFPNRKAKYEHLISGTNPKNAAELMQNPKFVAALQDEVVARTKRWFGIEFIAATINNSIGNILFLTVVNENLDNNRINQQSLAPEIITWVKEMLKSGDVELEINQDNLNSLYDDVSEDIALLKILRSEAQKREYSALGYGESNEPDADN